jgi:hypothetical protein
MIIDPFPFTESIHDNGKGQDLLYLSSSCSKQNEHFLSALTSAMSIQFEARSHAAAVGLESGEWEPTGTFSRAACRTGDTTFRARVEVEEES